MAWTQNGLGLGYLTAPPLSTMLELTVHCLYIRIWEQDILRAEPLTLECIPSFGSTQPSVVDFHGMLQGFSVYSDLSEDVQDVFGVQFCWRGSYFVCANKGLVDVIGASFTVKAPRSWQYVHLINENNAVRCIVNRETQRTNKNSYHT